MVILYGHPESGHTYKVALTLELAGIRLWLVGFGPRIVDIACFAYLCYDDIELA